MQFIIKLTITKIEKISIKDNPTSAGTRIKVSGGLITGGCGGVVVGSYANLSIQNNVNIISTTRKVSNNGGCFRIGHDNTASVNNEVDIGGNLVVKDYYKTVSNNIILCNIWLPYTSAGKLSKSTTYNLQWLILKTI